MRAPRKIVFTIGLVMLLEIGSVSILSADESSCKPSYPPTETEPMTVRPILAIDDAHEVLNTGDYNSPLASWGDSIYLAYINLNWQLSIAKGKATGNVEKRSVSERVQDVLPDGSDPVPDRDHMAPSLGVDKAGRLHLAGGMHHHPWKYYVSLTDGDISELTRVTSDSAVGIIPGYNISYPEFQQNSSGELFVSFRDRISPPYWKPGYLFGSIARYDAATKKWTALGGLNYEVPSYNSQDVVERLAVVWDLSGKNETAYQGYKLRLVFGKNDSLHLSWNIYRNPGDDASHLMYAASLNGLNWFRANGSAIEKLPITSMTGDLIWSVSPGDMYNLSGLAIGRDEKPIVSSVMSGVGLRYIHIYEPSCGGWLDRKLLPDDADIKIYSDATGTLTTFSRNAGQSVYRSHDNGWTWVRYPVPFKLTSSSRIDATFLRKTGKVRVTTQSGTTLSVYELTFGEKIQPPELLRVGANAVRQPEDFSVLIGADGYGNVSLNGVDRG